MTRLGFCKNCEMAFSFDGDSQSTKFICDVCLAKSAIALEKARRKQAILAAVEIIRQKE